MCGATRLEGRGLNFCFVGFRSGTDSDGDIIKDGISVHSWQDHDENDNEVSYFITTKRGKI